MHSFGCRNSNTAKLVTINQTTNTGISWQWYWLCEQFFVSMHQLEMICCISCQHVSNSKAKTVTTHSHFFGSCLTFWMRDPSKWYCALFAVTRCCAIFCTLCRRVEDVSIRWPKKIIMAEQQCAPVDWTKYTLCICRNNKKRRHGNCARMSMG